jgi:hypothetical protein
MIAGSSEELYDLSEAEAIATSVITLWYVCRVLDEKAAKALSR